MKILFFERIFMFIIIILIIIYLSNSYVFFKIKFF